MTGVQTCALPIYNLLMVLCMMTGAAVIVCNLLAQAISARIDPRLAGEEAAHG